MAERPQYLTDIDIGSHDLALITRLDHEREVEKLGWMASHGHLTELEVEIIERKAAEARERIGTDHEQFAALSPDYGGDKLDVALGDVMRAVTK